jgi:hypothetical protein
MDPNRLIDDLVKRGEAYADLDAAASVMEETKGSVLGQMVEAYIKSGKSATAAEHMAKASSMYQQHVAKMVEARRMALRAKVNYEAQQTYIELRRTEAATQRAEMRLGGLVS